MPTDNTDEVKLGILAGAVLDLLSALDTQDGWRVMHSSGVATDALSTVEEILKEFGLEYANDGAWYRAWADWQKQLPAAPEPPDSSGNQQPTTPGAALSESEEL